MGLASGELRALLPQSSLQKYTVGAHASALTLTAFAGKKPCVPAAVPPLAATTGEQKPGRRSDPAIPTLTTRPIGCLTW